MTPMDAICRTPALAGAPAQTLAQIEAASTLLTRRRGDCLWQMGALPQSLTILCTGLVKLVKEAPHGRITTCDLVGPPDCIDDAPLLKERERTTSAYVVSPLASFVDIPCHVLKHAIDATPGLALSVALALQAKLVALHGQIDVLSAGSVEARVAKLLMNLYERFGDDFDDGDRLIPVVLSRQDLADLVSTSVETVIRIMTRWEREGVVDTSAHGFVIQNYSELEQVLLRKVGRGS